jgi:hypothetical protein
VSQSEQLLREAEPSWPELASAGPPAAVAAAPAAASADVAALQQHGHPQDESALDAGAVQERGTSQVKHLMGLFFFVCKFQKKKFGSLKKSE